MPVSALPGTFGQGDFASASRWLAWLRKAGFRYWQILPLTIPDSVGSPFASPSAEAMNPTFMSLEWLVEDGLLTPHEVRTSIHRSRISARLQVKLIRRAWERWRLTASNQSAEFTRWRNTQPWLSVYCAYQAIKEHYGLRPWWAWPTKWRKGTTAIRQLTPELQRETEWHAWLQWALARQWERVHQTARIVGVTIIGDLPFYVQYDSVDVWLRPELFLLDRQRKMRFVSGAAPDVFSSKGQKWGTPVYHWAAHRRERWAWWLERITTSHRLYDIIRFDHFPGLQATWHVPIGARTGAAGKWVSTPGRELLNAIRRHLGYLPFIAEDLGRVSKVISTLRHDFRIPGSRVLQFAWSGLPNNFHEPRFVETNMVYYTANHDTNTTKGWFDKDARPHERKYLREFYGSTAALPTKFIHTVLNHRAKIAMLHIADIMSLGSEARINHPGTIRRNWTWQLHRWPSVTLARRLRVLLRTTGRLHANR